MDIVRLDNGQTPDQADTVMNDHTETTEEHCAKSVPVTAWSQNLSIMCLKIRGDSVQGLI